MSAVFFLVALAALAAPFASAALSLQPHYYPSAYAARNPPVQLWFLSPAEVGELISRIPLANYREVSPDAPVAIRYNPDTTPAHELRQEQVDVSQFHTQDGAGRAVFGYSSADQARVEARSGDGRVRGSYSYRDPTGKIVKVNYWDDGDGFHVAGNSLPSESDVPEQVTETPEVAAARLQHEHMHAQALQAALLAGSGSWEESDQPRVEGGGGDLPPVYAEDGTELRRYPAPQHASLYDPSHVHDADRDAVIITNPDLEPDSFNDIQLFRGLRARARGYHPRGARAGPASGRARRAAQQQPEQDEQVDQQDQAKTDGFFYSFRYPAPVLVGVRPPPSLSAPGPTPGVQAPEASRLGAVQDENPLSLSERAVYFGAIPVAAVHDAQVAPGQDGALASALQYARKPVYTEGP
ncbi:Cuticle protein 6 [Frankliniella fusca]|uniref:Cuticle protein 6 n=1 Tax=Frankliniella fusca TaxID=407009 RepID=A0AAE1LNJ6_9NEOP|nr:Cuticle protein 6 [Frankliniella fusca]